MPAVTTTPRAELHTHLGGAVDPPILWSIAHRQGIRLPTKDYWQFEAMVTMADDERNSGLNQMNEKFYRWTELIQSSPEAIQESVASVIGGGYRKCNLVLQELRFNPMFRNRRGERDLDHIINAARWGLEHALVEYPQVKAGIILMMDRRLTPKQNAIIVEKAIRYRGRGIIGIDLAGPDRSTFSMKKIAPLFQTAKAAGLGVTVHCGETGDLDELRYVVREIKPHRIGHGIAAGLPDVEPQEPDGQGHEAATRRDPQARRLQRADDHQHRRPRALRHERLQGAAVPAQDRRHVAAGDRAVQPPSVRGELHRPVASRNSAVSSYLSGNPRVGVPPSPYILGRSAVRRWCAAT